MTQPAIELIPVRPAVKPDEATMLDLLIRLAAPDVPLNAARPALNVGIVLDRSGSMAAARKIDYAREAAVFAVQQLLPSDRVSVTVFDDSVRTLVPSTLAENKSRIVDAIRGVEPGNSTALHAGWKEGASQVGQHQLKDGLNRVFLLSDGIANVGETSADAICTDVNRSARERIGTSTFGLGDEYNEDLLEAMAKSGDGNYFYIEHSKQLPDIFQTELKGLMATFGQSVQLKVEPQSGVAVVDVLNDFEKTPDDWFKLPNLVAGMPILAVVRLSVPPQSGTNSLLRVRLGWTAPNSASPQVSDASLALPATTRERWESLAANLEVEERAALLLIARYKKEATRCIDLGNPAEASGWLAKARQVLATAPGTPELLRESETLQQIEAMLASGETQKFQKHAKYQAHSRRRSRPMP